MGYSATCLDIRVDGPDPEKFEYHNIITEDRLPAVWDALVACEAAGGMGHISWVNDPLELEKPKHESLAHAVASVFEQYGFSDGEGTFVQSDGSVQIGYWSGDKLGSCWEGMLAAYAKGIDPELTVRFIMIGEDDDMWCTQLHQGEQSYHSITINVND